LKKDLQVVMDKVPEVDPFSKLKATKKKNLKQEKKRAQINEHRRQTEERHLQKDSADANI